RSTRPGRGSSWPMGPGPDAILANGEPKNRSESGHRSPGRVPERPKGAVCKIAGVAYAGSNPAPPTNERPNERTNDNANHPTTLIPLTGGGSRSHSPDTQGRRRASSGARAGLSHHLAADHDHRRALGHLGGGSLARVRWNMLLAR